jgi:hypothetical protein
MANVPKLQEPAEPALAEGSLLGHPETPTRRAPRTRPLPSEVHAIDPGPGAAALDPRWAVDYFMHEKFELPQLKDYVNEGSNISVSVGDYFSTMLDQSMNWQDAADVREKASGKLPELPRKPWEK